MSNDLPAVLPEGQDFVVACIVAPEGNEQAVTILTPQERLERLWWVQEVKRRANALEKGLLIELAMDIARMELTDPRIVVAGHTWMLRQDERVVWTDLGRTLGILERDYGIPGSDLRDTVSEARVTQLRDLAARIPDPEKRQAALDLIEGARTKKPTQLALVDLDDPYRRRK